MYKLLLQLARLAKILLGSGFLVGIMVFLPGVAKASNCFVQNLGHTAYDPFGYPYQQSIAQQFTVTGSCVVTDAGFNGDVHGTPTSIATALIEADAGGQPSDSILATSDSIDMNNTALEAVHFSTPATLTTGTYWFIITTDTTSSSNYYSYSGKYPHGAVDALSSASQVAPWSDETYSFDFLSIDDNSGGGGGGGGTTTIATTTTIDNPNQDVAMAMLLFFLNFYGIIWMFAKKR